MKTTKLNRKAPAAGVSTEDHRTIEDRLNRARHGVESRIRRDVRQALVNLYLFIPETRSPPRGAGSRSRVIPFVSEAWLYAHLGKEDARTFLALLYGIERAVGLDELEVRHAVIERFQLGRRAEEDR